MIIRIASSNKKSFIISGEGSSSTGSALVLQEKQAKAIAYIILTCLPNPLVYKLLAILNDMLIHKKPGIDTDKAFAELEQAAVEMEVK